MTRRLFKKIYLLLERHLLELKGKKDVLFVVENELMFGYAHEISKRLEGDRRLRVWFCVVYPERFRDLNMVRAKYNPRTVPYRIAKKLKGELIMFPNHGPYFRPDCPKIYIGHGLNSGKKVNGAHYVFGPKSLGEGGRIIYDKIFRSSEFAKEQARKYYPGFYPRIKVVGSLFSDEVLEGAADRNQRLASLGLDHAKKTIAFISSWGPDSLIQSQGVELIKQVPGISRNYNVIISAHPNNYNKVHYEGINLHKLFCGVNCKDTRVAGPEEGISLLSLADLLVTDMTSLGLYFPPLNRPIIFYDNANAEHDPVSVIPELRKAAHVVRGLSSLEEDIANAFQYFNRDKMEELAEKIFSYRGRAWERYSYEIYESLGIKEDGSGK